MRDETLKEFLPGLSGRMSLQSERTVFSVGVVGRKRTSQSPPDLKGKEQTGHKGDARMASRKKQKTL